MVTFDQRTVLLHEEEYGLYPAESAILQSFIADMSTYDVSITAHALRVAQLATALTHQLDLSNWEIQLTRLGALLHDIGKIAIPSRIVHKQGPLTEEEWSVMRSHPQLGAQKLFNAEGIFVHIAPMVMAHHEHWNGRGYPNGLAGENIPFSARVIGIIDAYDALTSCRSYHVAIDSTQACAEIQSCAGSQFDPQIVSSFLKMLHQNRIFN